MSEGHITDNRRISYAHQTLIKNHKSRIWRMWSHEIPVVAGSKHYTSLITGDTPMMLLLFRVGTESLITIASLWEGGSSSGGVPVNYNCTNRENVRLLPAVGAIDYAVIDVSGINIFPYIIRGDAGVFGDDKSINDIEEASIILASNTHYYFEVDNKDTTDRVYDLEWLVVEYEI